MMGRYAAIFGLILMMNAALFFVLAMFTSGLSGDNEVLTSLALLLVLLASFIITQLFYIIDFLKRNQDF
ncbi:hypothetical protein FZC79_17620 [Rossellomorea vietnamensis]|uniref:Uncharacterized protein n=1 Tax=Rossellomorea vietnamensis TaxID=218284 RepID=A0A5D4K8M8_9BACI|nr:hypothetical protein [Rossellomorea vietnamensis]TYR73694.1 hypothetical protein FZC79_17620 [Rossellomorea vietnamensis]